MTKRNARAVQVDGGLDIKEPGQFAFYQTTDYGERSGIIYGCPCGCGATMSLPIKGPRRWEAVGEWPNASLSPSIGILPSPGTKTEPVGPDGHFHWHGFLRNGVFEEC